MLSLEWISDEGADSLNVTAMDFDAIVHEQYDAPSEVTEHYVETGSAITDHVRPNADTITLEAWVSNSPLATPSFGTNGITVTPQAVSRNGVRFTTLKNSGALDRVGLVDGQLYVLRSSGTLLTVRTTLRTYSNVVIERYSVERDAPSGNSLHLTLELKRIRLVSTETVPATASSTRRGQHREQRGGQTPTPVDNRSAAARLEDSAGRPLERALAFLGGSS